MASWRTGAWAAAPPPLGIVEVELHDDGRAVMKLTSVKDHVAGVGRRAKAIIIIGESRETDEMRGQEVRLHFCPAGTAARCTAGASGCLHVTRCRPITSAVCAQARHWAHRLAGRLDRIDVLVDRARRGSENDQGGLFPPADADHNKTPPARKTVQDVVTALPGLTTSELQSLLPAFTCGEIADLRTAAAGMSHCGWVPEAIDAWFARNAPARGEPETHRPRTREDDQPSAQELLAQLVDRLGCRGRRKRHAPPTGSGALGSSGDESSSESDSRGYKPPTSSSLREANLAIHQKYPGMLAKTGLAQMAEDLGDLVVGAGEDEGALSSRRLRKRKITEMRAIVRTYVKTQLIPGLDGNPRSRREAETLAAVLDLLVRGRTEAAADVLMQRLKAVELAARDGWERATWLELLAPQDSLLASRTEQAGAAREEAIDRRARGRQRTDKGKNQTDKGYKGDKGGGKGSKGDGGKTAADAAGDRR